MENIREEMDQVIDALERKGVHLNSHIKNDVTGLGDIVESTLKTFGITEERFKRWFNLKECNCSKRKQWLNNLFSWERVHKNDSNNAE
jgi:hypothetical protein